MNHSRVAKDFMQHDFVIKSDKILNLYRNDIGEVVQMMTFLGLMNTWNIKIVNKSNENYLKNKIQEKNPT